MVLDLQSESLWPLACTLHCTVITTTLVAAQRRKLMSPVCPLSSLAGMNLIGLSREFPLPK